MPQKIALVIGVGPGLGMSIAHRFGREGYGIALVSRSDTRHAGYVKSLAEDVVWSYPEPFPRVEEIAGHLAFWTEKPGVTVSVG